MRIRDARDGDLPAMLEIYNDLIATTTAIYRDEPATIDERRVARVVRARPVRGAVLARRPERQHLPHREARVGEPVDEAVRRGAERAFGFATGRDQRRGVQQHGGASSIEHGQTIDRVASHDCRVAVVGNPANTNCMIAASVARRLGPERFTAMVRLDQNRAQTQLAKKAGVQLKDVSDVFIFGNHSPTMFSAFHLAKINGKPATDKVWEGSHGLEWTVPSPAPYHTFSVPPLVHAVEH